MENLNVDYGDFSCLLFINWPRDFHRPPRFAGDLITIFLKTMVLLIINWYNLQVLAQFLSVLVVG